MKNIFFLLLVCIFVHIKTNAQDDAKKYIQEVNKKFISLKSYKAHVNMHFDIPGVKMKKMTGKLLYKKPDKFRIKAKGIFFMPKQNPMQNIGNMLLDTSSYTAVVSGFELAGNAECAVINIIPLKSDNELILGKFWISKGNYLIMKSQITTKNNGTVETSSFYSTYVNYGLPSQTTIWVEMQKVKVPKMMAMDMKKKKVDDRPGDLKEKGRIELNFSDYQINAEINDTEFTEKEE